MKQNSWKATFSVKNEDILFEFKANELTVWEGKFKDGIIEISMLFTSHDEPLIVKAEAKVGDIVCFAYRPYRIELFVNEKLCDEEWPFGDHYLSDAVKVNGATDVIFSELEEKNEDLQPCIIGHFQNAEGWRPGNGVNVGDCMPYTFEDRYHVLYLKDRRRHTSKWGLGAHQWAHISTKDFVNWDVHPMAVEIDDPSEGSICTGSHIYLNGKHYLFYSVRTCDGTPAKIRRSVSEDGYHFKKDPGFSFTISDKYTGETARDPKVINGEDGLLHMFLTTTDKSIGKGVLLHLVSEDADNWEETGILYVRQDGKEPECPDYFKLNNVYYLVRDGHYVYSFNPYSDWIKPENDKLPTGRVPKSAVWNNRIIFTSFDDEGTFFGGTMTFLEATQNDDNQLTFKPFVK